MTSTTRMLSRVIALAGLVTAIVAVTAVSATASDKPAASYYTPAALKAMGERYQAAARFYKTHSQGVDRPAASYYTPAALKAMGERYQVAANFYEQLQLRKAQQQATSFHWRDAIVGGGVVLALIALALLSAQVIRHGRRPTPASS